MKTHLVRYASVLALSLLLTVSARALTFGDAYSLGSIVPGVPDDDASQVTLLNTLLDLAAGNDQSVNVFGGPHDPYTFDRTGNFQPGTGYADAVEAAALRDDSGNNVVDLGGGYLYLLAKYGAGGDVPGIGKTDNAFYVWYVGDLSGTLEIPDGGLSHFSLYNPGTSVPDGGMTAVLAGLGLLCLSLVARRR
jgi:hypothetical protein